MPNWNDVLVEINDGIARGQFAAQRSLDIVRRKYLTQLHNHTGRNVIAYYSGWLSKPNILLSDINDEDKNGFMMAVHRLERKRGLDLILHTPGGDIASTQSIVDYLQQMFSKDIRAIVPQIAMSAGTMMACSCRQILMAKHSNLGPIDPHLRGLPAAGVINEFKRAFKEIAQEPAKLAVWREILAQYRPTFLSQCENAIKWSNNFVAEQLESIMFAGKRDAKRRSRRIVKHLSDFTGNKTHSRHIHFEECKKIGLNVSLIEDDSELQDLVLTVHHCYMHVCMNTPAFKIIENHLGTAIVKSVSQTPEMRLVQT